MGSKGSPQVFGGIVAAVRKRYEGGGTATNSSVVGARAAPAREVEGVAPPSTPGTRRFRATTRLSLNHAGVAATPAAASTVLADTTSSSPYSSSGRSNTSTVPVAERYISAIGKSTLNNKGTSCTSNCSSSLLRQASDSGVSITSSIGGEEDNNIGPTKLLSSPPPSVSNSSAIELTSAKLKELDDFNRQLLAELASQTLGDNSSSSCNSLLEAARAEEVAVEAFNQIKEDANWKTAWKELAGVTPSRRLLQLMRRLQAKWNSDSSNTALAHVTLARTGEGGARPLLRGSALFDNTQRVAVASPSGALVASRGGQVRSYVNTKGLAALRQDLITNSTKSNIEQNNDLVCLTTDSNQKWQTFDVDDMTHQRDRTITPPMRPNRIKGRAPPGPVFNRRGASPQLDYKPPSSPLFIRKQPPSPQMTRKHPPSPNLSRSRPPSPQLHVTQPLPSKKQSISTQAIRGQPSSPTPSRRPSISQQYADGTQVIRVQPPPSPRLGHSQPASPVPFRRCPASPQLEKRPARSRDSSANRGSDGFLDTNKSQRTSPGLPRPGGSPVTSPREHIAQTRGRCPQAKSALHNPRTARSQTRGDSNRVTHRGSSQPPAHYDPNRNISSKLKQDVLAAFGVKLNGVSRTLPHQLSSTPVYSDISTVRVPVSSFEYDDERKHSLESNSSGISGCSQDSFNGLNDSAVINFIERYENVATGLGYSPHAHVHQPPDSHAKSRAREKRIINVTHQKGNHCNGSIDDDHVVVLSERSSPSQVQQSEQLHGAPQLLPSKRRMASSRPTSEARPRKPSVNSSLALNGLSDYNGSSSCSSSGSNDSNKENKKHRSRVHLGGDAPIATNNEIVKNNVNNAISNGNKTIKATTISINMGPIQHMYGASVVRCSPRQTRPSQSSRPSVPSRLTSSKINTSVKKPAEERFNINSVTDDPKLYKTAIVKDNPRKVRDTACEIKWNGSGSRSGTVSANSHVSTSVVRRDPLITNCNKVTRNSDRTRRECPLTRDNKPVSRLVRQGTFRIVETRDENGQDITPSIRLRYLMQRAQSGDDSSSSQPDTSPPSPTQLDQLILPTHNQQVGKE